MIKPLIPFLDQDLHQLPFIVHLGKQSKKKDNAPLVQHNSSNHLLFYVSSESDFWQKLPEKDKADQKEHEQGKSSVPDLSLKDHSIAVIECFSLSWF